MKNKIDGIVYSILTVLIAGAIYYFLAVKPPRMIVFLFRAGAFVAAICILFCLFIEWAKKKRSAKDAV